MWPYLAALALGIITGVVIEPLRLWCFRPRLRLAYDEKDCRIKTPAEIGSDKVPTEAWFVRIRVDNKSWIRKIAKNCTGYLVGLEKEGLVNGQAVSFTDSIPLAWSYRHVETIDLPRGLPAFVDVLHTAEEGKGRFYFCLGRHEPKRYESLRDEQGTFIFKILVAAENVAPKTIRLKFKWSGDWQNFGVRELPRESRSDWEKTKQTFLAVAQRIRARWKRLRECLKRLP